MGPHVGERSLKLSIVVATTVFVSIIAVFIAISSMINIKNTVMIIVVIIILIIKELTAPNTCLYLFSCLLIKFFRRFHYSVPMALV